VRDKSETVSELEIRFGTNPVWRNRWLNYDNVVKSRFVRVFHGQRRRDAFIARPVRVFQRNREYKQDV
jgi:hypothetical protein